MRRLRESDRERGNDRIANLFRVAETFPLIGSTVFAGPPGRTFWVYRRAGIDDALTPSAEERRGGRLRMYDLFSSKDYGYIGTVRAPRGMDLMTGESTRVAGKFTSELGVQTVRALRLVSLSPATVP